MPENLMRNTETGNIAAETAMQAAYTTCNNVYTRVDGERDILRANWQGSASDGYGSALALWLEELRLITNGMNEMIGLFGGTVNAMHGAEDEALMEGSSWIGALNPNQPSA